MDYGNCPFNLDKRAAGEDWFHGFMSRKPNIMFAKTWVNKYLSGIEI